MHDTEIPDVPRTIAELPFFCSGRYPRPQLLGRAGTGGMTWVGGRELVDRVRDLSLGLAALGVRRGDRVVLLSESRPEWMLVDLAILTLGAVTTPLYPTLSVEQVTAILQDCEPVVAIASSPVQLAKLLVARESVPSIAAVVDVDQAAVTNT